MKLSLGDIRNLIYGFDQFDFQRPLSCHPNEFPLYKIKIVPIEIGVTLAALDPNEEYFKVFNIFLAKPPRSEIWHKRAWDESMTRKCGYKPATDYSGNGTTLHDRVQNLVYDLMHSLSLSGITQRQARVYAEQFIYGPTISKDLLSVTPVDQSLTDRLFQMRDLLAKEVTSTTTTDTSATPNDNSSNVNEFPSTDRKDQDRS